MGGAPVVRKRGGRILEDKHFLIFFVVVSSGRKLPVLRDLRVSFLMLHKDTSKSVVKATSKCILQQRFPVLGVRMEGL